MIKLDSLIKTQFRCVLCTQDSMDDNKVPTIGIYQLK